MKRSIAHTQAFDKLCLSGYLLFAIVVISCVFILLIMMNDVLTVANTSGISRLATALPARCGMDAQTYMRVSPIAQQGLEALCSDPAELQP
jgi:hypothetical protein